MATWYCHPKEEETKQDEVCDFFFLSAWRYFLKSIHSTLRCGICTQVEYSVLVEFHSKLGDELYLSRVRQKGAKKAKRGFSLSIK